MAAVVRNYYGGNSGGSSVATSSAIASGTPAAGNLLVAFVAYRTVTGVTVTASGWTAQTPVANGTVGGHTILTKIADGTEGGTMTFQLGASVEAAVAIEEFSSASATLKSVGAGAVDSTASATHTGSSVTPLISDVTVFFDNWTSGDTAAYSSNASATPTTGWLARSNAKSTGSVAANRNVITSMSITARTAATIPSVTWTASGTGTKQQLLVQNPFVPNAPTPSAATLITSSGFTANWAPGATDSTHDAPTSYKIDVWHGNVTFGGVGAVTDVNNASLGNVLSDAITGLTSGTTYYYRVRGTNAVGTSGSSSTTTVVLLNTVGQDKQLAWNDRVSVNQTKQLSWYDHIAILSTKQNNWNIRSAIAQTKQATWNDRAFINKTDQLSWNIRVTIANTIDTEWNIVPPFVSVGQDLVLAWNVRISITQDKQVLWNTLSTIAQTK